MGTTSSTNLPNVIPDGEHKEFRFFSNPVSIEVISFDLKGEALFSGTIMNGIPKGYCRIVYLDDTEKIPSQSVVCFMQNGKSVGKVVRTLNRTDKNHHIIDWNVYEDGNGISYELCEYTDSNVRKNVTTVYKDHLNFIRKTTSTFCPLYFYTEVESFCKTFKNSSLPVRVPFIPFHELLKEFYSIEWSYLCDAKLIGQTEYEEEKKE